MTVRPLQAKVVGLQKKPEQIRNCCVLAHVDHGKTTLVDHLLASNGLISQRMAGSLRYLDSLEQEQSRGITMKCSSVSLVHEHETSTGQSFLVNLVDSPGHVDFTTEVWSAVRLCDGCLVVVDAVEGVCAQTISVLRLAWIESLVPVLIINKIDRLFGELKLDVMAIYVLLQRLLENVNAICAQIAAEYEQTDSAVAQPGRPVRRARLSSTTGFGGGYQFSPELGNVVFCSAVDGWAFRCSDFARMYSAKFGIRDDTLRQSLWGDFYLNAKKKQVERGAAGKAKKPLFVQFILENLDQIYSAAASNDMEQLKKIADAVRKLRGEDAGNEGGFRSQKQPYYGRDAKSVLRSVLTHWLPLYQAVLDSVVDLIPAPNQLLESRAELLTKSVENDAVNEAEIEEMRNAILRCDRDGPVVALVSKWFPIDSSLILPDKKKRPLTHEEISARRQQAKLRYAERIGHCSLDVTSRSNLPLVSNDHGSADDLKPSATIEAPTTAASTTETESDENCFQLDCTHYVGFGRVFSGVLRDKKPVFHMTSSRMEKALQVKLDKLYSFLGARELLGPFDEIGAGNLCGIIVADLPDEILVRPGTVLCDKEICPFLLNTAVGNSQEVGIVRVAIEPTNPADLPKLVSGLKQLKQADPAVQTLLQETGEHVIVCAGEVHLQRCIEDLKHRFANVDLRVSDLIVPFRETIVRPSATAAASAATTTTTTTGPSSESIVEVSTANSQCQFRLTARPLPAEVVEFLEENVDLVRSFSCVVPSQQLEENRTIVCERLATLLDDDDEFDQDIINRIWSFGPKLCGANILVNSVKSFSCFKSVFRSCGQRDTDELGDDNKIRCFYEDCIVNAFQQVTNSGPICEEPMMGVCFELIDWTINVDESTQIDGTVLSAQILRTLKDGLRSAFQQHPQRLMLPMYCCDIQAHTEVLGRLYGVLSRRMGNVLQEEMKEGSQAMFEVRCSLPVLESFGFAEELRSKCRGLATPAQLRFSHWEVLPSDPFWTPIEGSDDEENEALSSTNTIAKRYMNRVRKRKGLHVDEQLVSHAEKQRTLKKNK